LSEIGGGLDLEVKEEQEEEEGERGGGGADKSLEEARELQVYLPYFKRT